MSKFTFKKKYGQNFLKSEQISNLIVDSIKPTNKDLIIEIGPGSGMLTKKLKRYNTKLVAYEIDTELSKFLSNIEDTNTKVIYEDFLSADIKKVIDEYNYEKIYVIGNLPYYITTPIIEKIIDSGLDPESITIMVQKEVGERFLAKPCSKDYGYMTVLLNYWYKIDKITNVPRNNFYPEPNVDSMVIKLSKKERININYQKFNTILKDSFQFKRKTINNNLKKYNRQIVENILAKHNYSLNSRAEELSIETFIDLANNL